MMGAERKKQVDGIGIPISESNTERMNLDPKLLFGDENRLALNGSADVMTSLEKHFLNRG